MKYEHMRTADANVVKKLPVKLETSLNTIKELQSCYKKRRLEEIRPIIIFKQKKGMPTLNPPVSIKDEHRSK